MNCPQCHYDRTGLEETHACPECGLALRPGAVVQEGWSDGSPPSIGGFLFGLIFGLLATAHTYNAIKSGFLWGAVGGVAWAFFMWLLVYGSIRKFILARARAGDVRLTLDDHGVRAFGDAKFDHPWAKLRPPKCKVTKDGLRLKLNVKRGAAFTLLARDDGGTAERDAAAIKALYAAAVIPGDA